jgi:hypothetical protein
MQISTIGIDLALGITGLLRAYRQGLHHDASEWNQPPANASAVASNS